MSTRAAIGELACASSGLRYVLESEIESAIAAAVRNEWQLWRHAIEDVQAVGGPRMSCNDTCTAIIAAYERRSEQTGKQLTGIHYNPQAIRDGLP